MPTLAPALSVCDLLWDVNQAGESYKQCLRPETQGGSALEHGKGHIQIGVTG